MAHPATTTRSTTKALTAALFLTGALTVAGCDSSSDPISGPITPADSAASVETVLAVAPAPARVDQVQKIADPSRPLAIYPAGLGQNLAQTFTAGLKGDLAYVWMPIACASGSLVKIQIRQGGPTGRVVSDYNYDPAHTVQDGTFLNFQVYPYVPTAPGTRYAIVLSSVAGSGSKGTPTCSIASGPKGDPYMGGGAYYEDIPVNGPGWVPLPDPRLHGDLPFVTMVW
jgi:hypothetical protein